MALFLNNLFKDNIMQWTCNINFTIHRVHFKLVQTRGLPTFGTLLLNRNKPTKGWQPLPQL